MNNKQRLLTGALLLGGGVVLGALAINVAENSANENQKQMSPAVQGKVLQPSEQSAIPDKEDSLAPVELKELPHGGSPSMVNTVAEQMAKKAEIDRLSRHYQDAEQKAQEAQRNAQQVQLQQALDAQKKLSLLPEQNQAEKQRQAELQAKAEAERKRLAEQAEAKRKAEAEKRRLAEQAEAKRRAELATEAEKKRQLETAKTDAEKKRQAEQAEAKRKEAEVKRKAELAKTEAEKKRQAEQAKAEAEKKRKAELAKAEADKKRQEEAEKKRKAEQAKKDAKSSPKDHAQWMVQIALADKENASAMAGKLRSKGYRVTLSPTSKGVRVLVGPHKDRATADSVRQRIAGDGSLNMRSAWVHSWVPLEYRK